MTKKTKILLTAMMLVSTASFASDKPDSSSWFSYLRSFFWSAPQGNAAQPAPEVIAEFSNNIIVEDETEEEAREERAKEFSIENNDQAKAHKDEQKEDLSVALVPYAPRNNDYACALNIANQDKIETKEAAAPSSLASDESASLAETPSSNGWFSSWPLAKIRSIGYGIGSRIGSGISYIGSGIGSGMSRIKSVFKKNAPQDDSNSEKEDLSKALVPYAPRNNDQPAEGSAASSQKILQQIIIMDAKRSLRQEEYFHRFMAKAQENLAIQTGAEKEEEEKQSALISKAGKEAALKANRIAQEKADRNTPFRNAPRAQFADGGDVLSAPLATPKLVKKSGRLASIAISAGYDKVFNSGVMLGFNAGVGYSFGSIKQGNVVYKNKGFLFVKPRIGYTFSDVAFGVTPGLIVKREKFSGIAGFDGKTTVQFMPGAFVEFKPSKRFTTTLSYDFIPGFSAKNSAGVVMANKSAEHKISIGFKYNF